MRLPTFALSAAVALTGAATPALAQTTTDRADVRCLMVLQVLGRDERNKEAAGKGVFYYLGRLQARGLTPKLGSLFQEEAKIVTTPQQGEAEAKRCSGELTAHGAELRSVYERLAPPRPPAAAPPAKK
jgi:hypothetical protein